MALTATEEALVRQLIDQQAAILSLAGNESTITSKLGATKVTLADLPNAPSIGDTDLFLIRQGSQEKNVTGAVVKALASASVSGSTTTAAGIIEIATDAEVQTGTDADRAITPSGLSSRTATETRTGIVELSTDAEAQAFTANKFIDGAKLNTALKGSNQNLSSSGYQKLPGGLIIQWGYLPGSNGSSGSIVLPIPFPSSFSYLETQDNVGTIYSGKTRTLSGFDWVGSGSNGLNWLAIGY